MPWQRCNFKKKRKVVDGIVHDRHKFKGVAVPDEEEDLDPQDDIPEIMAEEGAWIDASGSDEGDDLDAGDVSQDIDTVATGIRFADA